LNKSNIISFFEFLSCIVRFGSSEAINKLGGAGSVFSKRDIEKITVDNDRFENVLKIKFVVIENGRQITLPITSMSDGTIKWLPFITSILTSPAVFSIEEPENYLAQ
jgi:predicted ATPase